MISPRSRLIQLEPLPSTSVSSSPSAVSKPKLSSPAQPSHPRTLPFSSSFSPEQNAPDASSPRSKLPPLTTVLPSVSSVLSSPLPSNLSVTTTSSLLPSPLHSFTSPSFLFSPSSRTSPPSSFSKVTPSSVDERFDAPRLRALREKQYNKTHGTQSTVRPIATTVSSFATSTTTAVTPTPSTLPPNADRTSRSHSSFPSASSLTRVDHATLARELFDDDLDKWLEVHANRPAWHFDRFQRFQLKKFFKTLDADGSGEIDIGELEGPLLSTGLVYNQASLEELIKRIDKDKSGEIDYYEFLAAFKPVEARQRMNKEDAVSLYKYKQQQLLRGKTNSHGHYLDTREDNRSEESVSDAVFQDLLDLLTGTGGQRETKPSTTATTAQKNSHRKSTSNNVSQGRIKRSTLQETNKVSLDFEEDQRLLTQRAKERQGPNADERLYQVQNQPVPAHIQQSLAVKKQKNKTRINSSVKNVATTSAKSTETSTSASSTVPDEPAPSTIDAIAIVENVGNATENEIENSRSIDKEEPLTMNTVPGSHEIPTIITESIATTPSDEALLYPPVSTNEPDPSMTKKDTPEHPVRPSASFTAKDDDSDQQQQHFPSETNTVVKMQADPSIVPSLPSFTNPSSSSAPINKASKKLSVLPKKTTESTLSSPTSSTTDSSYQAYLSIPMRVSQYRRKFLLQLLIIHREEYNQTKHRLQHQLHQARKQKNSIEINGLLDDIKQVDNQYLQKIERLNALVHVIQQEKQHVIEYLDHEHQQQQAHGDRSEAETNKE